jgi:hypothetical protein
MSGLEFIVGYDIEQFEEYYIGLNDLHTFYRTRGLRVMTRGDT